MGEGVGSFPWVNSCWGVGVLLQIYKNIISDMSPSPPFEQLLRRGSFTFIKQIVSDMSLSPSPFIKT